MIDFFVDLLPDDAREIFRRRAQFRLVKLGSILALTIATGVVVNSFVELRQAKAQHEVIVALREKSNKIDKLVELSAQERTRLRSEIVVGRCAIVLGIPGSILFDNPSIDNTAVDAGGVIDL